MDEKFYISESSQITDITFREIFEQYRIRLCYFATKLLSSKQDAEDVVQEAFLKLWSKRNRFHDLNAIKAFLYITVKNRCIDITKHHKIIRHYEWEQTEGAEEVIMMKLIESEVIEIVRVAIQKLPPGCRNVVIMSYFEKLKNKEISDQLHISVNTVKTQKARGLHLLSDLLKKVPVLLLIATFFK